MMGRWEIGDRLQWKSEDWRLKIGGWEDEKRDDWGIGVRLLEDWRLEIGDWTIGGLRIDEWKIGA